MIKRFALLVGASLLLLVSGRAADDTKTFQLKGVNPDGKGGYTGSVEVQKVGDTFAIKWITGSNKQATLGFGIEGAGTIGAGYGGSALYSVVVYEVEGDKIKATWAMQSQPGTKYKYELTGNPEWGGHYKFSDGTPGSVTMTSTAPGRYKMSWDLASGHFEGVGVKVGRALVAVSGEPGKIVGVAGYQKGATGLDGVWSSTRLAGVGKELWSMAGGAPPPPTPASAPAASPSGSLAKGGKAITFGGEQYLLKDNQSAPGKATSELREYLREGESWEGYRKMVGLRMMAKELNGDAATLARGTLEETKKNFPQSYTRELLMEPDHAVIIFTVVAGEQAEYNIFDYRRTKNGFPSAQFVMRNKPPYETQDKFKAERNAGTEKWMAELAALSSRAEEILAATSGAGILGAEPGAGTPATVPPPAEPKKEPVSPDLVNAIQADLQKCSVVAEKFLTAMKAGDVKGAVGLMGEKAFAKTSREERIALIMKMNSLLGTMKNFTPDRQATDFGVVDGVMTFTLKGNGEYANGATVETLKFIRQDGEVQMVDYSRGGK